MAGKPVYVLHAANDLDVFQSLGQASIDFYTSISTTDNLNMNIGKDMGRNFGHAFTTDNNEPETILQFLYPGITASPPEANSGSTLQQFDQRAFCFNQNCSSAYLADYGYYYVLWTYEYFWSSYR